MKEVSRHNEWLSLMDVSGPFLAIPVLNQAFPQGLEELNPLKKKMLRQAYSEWREAQDLDDIELPEIHRAWIDLVLKQGLELDEDEAEDVLKSAKELPDTLSCLIPEHGLTLQPDFVVIDEQKGNKPLMHVSIYNPDIDLDKSMKGNGWAASPAERMVHLCRATSVRLGLVTNGERWMLVGASVGSVTTFASWYSRLWGQEPVTLQAFVTLLGIRRFFVDESEQLPTLLDDSLKHQDEVTDALGEQISRAVEVLIQTLDRADVDRNRELLLGVEPTELYEAGLTVMMRIVFLLSAEERGLLLLGDERYEANYAVSTLRMQLRSESEEILERRWDAWSRLLALFRAVYGGIEHEALRMPALGGSLFDPDRFPFLEGRAKGTNWKHDPATPLPIDNRTVLLLLDAVQLFQGRTLSYRALDVEQIGHVYEGLLERTVVRAKEVTLDLDATKNAKKPWVTLGALESARLDGEEAVVNLLKEHTGSAISRVRNDLKKLADESASDKLLTACHGDQSLRDRIKPYFNLLRTDRWGYPLVYPERTFMVTTGSDRRETGTHYTPKSLTEALVKETLEPIVYVGPAEGEPRENWILKSPAELLNLKICDPAMGSGAFLVQVCRWLSERLVESWTDSEEQGNAVTSEGVVVEKSNGYEPLRPDAEERLLTARRLIAERCLYGVDINPLAVELAKLSIWLVTLAKGRPFGFLDHNLRYGDSLLGIQSLDQLLYLEMNPGKGSSKKLFAQRISQAIEGAIQLRAELRERPIRDIRDVEIMAHLDARARKILELPELIADAFIGEVLAAKGKAADTTLLSIEAGAVMAGTSDGEQSITRRAITGLSTDLPSGKSGRKPFHWPLEFPEVFSRENPGFDAIIGNPPFLGGKLISGAFGSVYQKYLVTHASLGYPSSVDLVVHFFLKAHLLLRENAYSGLLGRRSIIEAKNRDVGLSQLLGRGLEIYLANTNLIWPGKASVVVHQIHMTTGNWLGDRILNEVSVKSISAELSDKDVWEIQKLIENLGRIFQGTILNGEGFKVEEQQAKYLLRESRTYEKVLFPFVGGNEVNSDPACKPKCWVINFWDWPETKAKTFKDVYEIAEEQVKTSKKNWWLFLRPRPALYHAIGRGHCFDNHPDDWSDVAEKLSRVLVISTGTTKYPAFTFLPNDFIYSNKLCVLADDRYSIFAILSSDIHGIWAWAQKTTLQADMESMRYAHGNIFDTYPFPKGLLRDGDSELERLGRLFFEGRQSYMEERNVGLTKFYNEFHDPDRISDDISELRRIQVQINEYVCIGYSWQDIELACGFHDVGYLPEGKNTRFTISEKARDELLYCLAMLNKSRHEEEALQNPAESNNDKSSVTQSQKQRKKVDSASQMSIFEGT